MGGNDPVHQGIYRLPGPYDLAERDPPTTYSYQDSASCRQRGLRQIVTQTECEAARDWVAENVQPPARPAGFQKQAYVSAIPDDHPNRLARPAGCYVQ